MSVYSISMFSAMVFRPFPWGDEVVSVNLDVAGLLFTIVQWYESALHWRC